MTTTQRQRDAAHEFWEALAPSDQEELRSGSVSESLKRRLFDADLFGAIVGWPDSEDPGWTWYLPEALREIVENQEG